MSDVLDIEFSEELDVGDEGDRELARLKDKAKKKRGRGFGNASSSHEHIDKYESVSDGGGGRRDDEEPGPQKSVEGWILFVTSLHEEAQEEDILELFADYGKIKNLNVNLDRRTGFLKGYAMVEYETQAEAQAAKDALNGSQLLGQTIGVEWCFVKGPQKSKRSSSRRRR